MKNNPIISTIDQLNLYQIVSSPTRKIKTIDLFFTPTDKFKFIKAEPVLFSDHNLLFFSLTTNPILMPPDIKYTIHFEHFLALTLQNNHLLFQCNIFDHVFYYNLLAKASKPTINYTLLSSKSIDPQDLYENSILKEANIEPKRAWSKIFFLINKKAKNEIPLNEHENYFILSCKINEFFSKIFNPSHITPILKETNLSLLNPIERTDIIDVILSSKSRKRKDCNFLSFEILLAMPKQFFVSLALYYTHILHTGIIPQEWLNICINPIIKTSKYTDFNDLRPISKLPIFMSILDRILADHLIMKSDYENIDSHQYGFKKQKNTYSNLYYFFNTCQSIITKRKSAIIIYIDKKKHLTRSHSMSFKKPY